MIKHKGTTPIETPRLLLRPMQLEDAGDMYRNWASDPEVTRYLTWSPHKDESETVALLKTWVSQYQTPTFYLWGICMRDQGKVLGTISTVKLFEDIDACELGYCISHAYWGRGLMTEALSGVLAHLLIDVGFRRVAARHDASNPSSGRVMEKCGMLYEGCSRQADRTNQGIVDCRTYAILRQDLLGN